MLSIVRKNHRYLNNRDDHVDRTEPIKYQTGFVIEDEVFRPLEMSVTHIVPALFNTLSTLSTEIEVKKESCMNRLLARLSSS